MPRNSIVASTLVALVSVPGFLVGQRLRQGDSSSVVMLAAVMMMVVVVASAIMRQSD
ncbi:MAG: hypothetical protein JWN48_2933 [Myxococcaceae bacterium]|nr:hypothetical protein [Myxococcaceae bacterium]